MLSLVRIFTFLVTTSGPLPDSDNYNYTPPATTIDPTESATDIMAGISGWMTAMIGGIAVLLIIVGGIQYAMALGDQDKIHAAKRTIMYAVVGLVIALLSYVIVPLIAKLFQ